MALPPREQRHRFLRYEGLEYTDSDIADFESRMAMEHRDEAGVVVFTISLGVVSVRWSQEMIKLEVVYSGLGFTHQGGDGVPRFS
ncbi:hypothetical protein Tco_0082144 [Tanacetum coccineum]